METPISFETDMDKLKKLTHYICAKAPNPYQLGATKLNKILWRSDFGAYLHTGKPITGEVYIKHQFGPVPQHINEILRELRDVDKAIAISEASGYSIYMGEPYTQRLFFSLTRPSLSGFTAEEISIVDDMIHLICTHHTARSISDASHDIIWKNAEIGEEIPYHTAFVNLLGEITPEDIDWAKSEFSKRV